MSKSKKAAKKPKIERTPIRFQISAPVGGAVEAVLLDLLADIPEPLRSSVSLGSLFRRVMLENDKEIANMIATAIKGQTLH